MRQKYIILENSGGSPGIPFPLGSRRSSLARGPGIASRAASPGIAFPLATSDTPPRLSVRVESLSAREAEGARREFSAIAPVMPTKLIAPAAEATAAESGTPSSWGLEWVHSQNWTGSDVPVAVLDTGIRRSHQAFAGIDDLIEMDFSESGNGDVNGHGTHVAGTVFGRDVDGRRIGVARGVTRALIGKVLGDDGRGTSEMMFAGMRWAINSGAKVVNMSLGFDFPGLVAEMVDAGWPADLATSHALVSYRMNADMFSAIMEIAVANIPFDGGCVFVGAAGNESQREIHPDYEIAVSLPADTEGIVSVGALEQSEGGLQTAEFSNTGPVLSAPGVDILSAWNTADDALAALNGTSMASPHVAGVAALWWEKIKTEEMVPATSAVVMADLVGDATTEGLAPDSDRHDHGKGIVQAPN